MKIEENISLLPFNTFNIDVGTRYYMEINSMTDIQEYISEKKIQKYPRLILGGGSNILFTKNFIGIVLKNNLKGISVIKETAENYFIKVAAGENWHQFVLYCIENNYAGIENLSLIPGCVGASPMQNIGAYGTEVKDVIEEVEAIELETNEEYIFSNASCKFDYRSSIFKTSHKNKFIITSVTFKLNKKPIYNTSYGAIEDELKKMGVKTLSIKAISEAVCRIRSSKLPNPKDIGNAGSFFKNPIVSKGVADGLLQNFPEIPIYNSSPETCKLAAGWLIEKCGWKGKKIENYGVHAKQALVLVNYGGANGSNILKLADDIISSVKNKFGVVLEKEVNII